MTTRRDQEARAAPNLFLDRSGTLTRAVGKARAADPTGYHGTAQAKLLAILSTLMFETIPSDPTRPEYRQGSTLGSDRKHWFRTKLGNGRFGLFFRYDGRTKIVLPVWVDDRKNVADLRRKDGRLSILKGMLDEGHPPDDWPS